MIFRTLPDGNYHAADAERGIEFNVARLREKFGELIGELSVSSGILSARAVDGVISSGTFNFSAPRDRDSWSKRLAARARTNGKCDWFGLLEELAQRVIEAERNGHTPTVLLRNVPPRPAAQTFDFLGLKYPRDHASGTFGPGDSLKSYLMLAMANAQARDGIRVALCDWELTAHEHRERQARIDPELPDILYVPCDKPLAHDVDRLRRIVRSERIEYAHFDSAAYGTEGKPEDAASAMSYFRALRVLGIGCNVIAHSRREDGDQQPFGSVFWFNSFRAAWNIKRAATTPDGNTVTLGAFPRKYNLGPPPIAAGLTVQFDGDRVSFTRTDIATIDELAESVPLWQRIRAVVRTGPQTLATIASELNYDNVNSLDRIIRRHKTTFTKVPGADGIARIALVERRAS